MKKMILILLIMAGEIISVSVAAFLRNLIFHGSVALAPLRLEAYPLFSRGASPAEREMGDFP